LYELSTAYHFGVIIRTARRGSQGTESAAVAVDPQIAGTVYAATIHGVFKSTDNGATWVPMTGGAAPPGGAHRVQRPDRQTRAAPRAISHDARRHRRGGQPLKAAGPQVPDRAAL